MRFLRGHRAVMLATAAMSSIAGLAGCEATTGASKVQAAVHAAQQASKVAVVHPTRMTLERKTDQPGQVEAIEVAPLFAKISGFIHKIHVDIGSEVKAGDLLAEIAAPEIEAEVKQKQAIVDQSAADLERAMAAVKVAQALEESAAAKRQEAIAGIKRADAELKRWQSEHRRTEQLVQSAAQPPSLLDEARSKLDAAEAARDEVRAKVTTAEAAVGESRAAVTRAKADVTAAAAAVEVAKFDARRTEALQGYMRIIAPFAGIVTERNADTGYLTVPGTAVKPLLVIMRSDIVTVAVDVPERIATMVRPGSQAEVRVQAIEGRVIRAPVSRTAWALDAKTRTLRTEIDIPNKGGDLRPGQYAQASIVVQTLANALTIPNTAIIRAGEKTICVCVEAGKAVRKPVQIGISDGTKTVILAGLKGDELVVKAEGAALADGQPVTAELETSAPKIVKP